MPDADRAALEAKATTDDGVRETPRRLGMLKILGLRARAEQALGPKFALKEFHDTLLRHGAVPLDLLEELVNEWIAAKRRA